MQRFPTRAGSASMFRAPPKANPFGRAAGPARASAPGRTAFSFTAAVGYAPFPAIHKHQILSRRRALPFSNFSVSSGPSGNVFSHSVPGRFSANG